MVSENKTPRFHRVMPTKLSPLSQPGAELCVGTTPISRVQEPWPKLGCEWIFLFGFVLDGVEELENTNQGPPVVLPAQLSTSWTWTHRW